MPTFLLSRISILLLIATVCGFNAKARTSQALVSFYKTSLGCSKVPELGCGSSSRPLLVLLEQNPAVQEAWLNRQGTVIAIVWKDREQTQEVAAPAFATHDIPLTMPTNEEISTYQATFRKEGLWYHHTDVDLLSLEEAGKIMASALAWGLKEQLLTTTEAGKVEAEVAGYLEKQAVAIRAGQNEQTDMMQAFQEVLFAALNKHLGAERARNAISLYQDSSGK